MNTILLAKNMIKYIHKIMVLQHTLRHLIVHNMNYIEEDMFYGGQI